MTAGEGTRDPGRWIKDLAAAHRTFADRLADRLNLLSPSRDPDYGDLGQAFPLWPGPGHDAILQPPSRRSGRPRTSSSTPSIAMPTSRLQTDGYRDVLDHEMTAVGRGRRAVDDLRAWDRRTTLGTRPGLECLRLPTRPKRTGRPTAAPAAQPHSDDRGKALLRTAGSRSPTFRREKDRYSTTP